MAKKGFVIHLLLLQPQAKYCIDFYKPFIFGTTNNYSFSLSNLKTFEKEEILFYPEVCFTLQINRYGAYCDVE